MAGGFNQGASGELRRSEQLSGFHVEPGEVQQVGWAYRPDWSSLHSPDARAEDFTERPRGALFLSAMRSKVAAIELRPAVARDDGFARDVYIETLRPYVSAWGAWDEDATRAEFDALWRPEDTSIILSDGVKVGWLEVRETRDEVYLEQLFVAPSRQRRGIGSAILRHLIEEWSHTGKPMALFVLKNNPAVRLYKRFGFRITGEIDHRLVMRRTAEGEARPCALACTSGAVSQSDQ